MNLYIFAVIFAVGLFAVVITLLVLLVRTSSRGIKESAPVGRDSRILFAVTRWGAIGYAALMTIVTLVAVITVFVGDVTMDVPVAQFWPTVDPRITIDPTDATIVGGGLTTASLTIAGLDLPARLLLALEAILWGGMIVTIAIAIARIVGAVEGGRPFTSVLPRATTAAAIAVGIGGFGAQLVGGIASSMASYQALDITSWSAIGYAEDEEVILGLPEPALLVQVDFWPIMLFVVLAALAAVFTHAERLQRQAARLQRDTEQLKRDTAGLV